MKKALIVFVFAVISKSLAAQVNPQTGSAVFNLPVFEWNDDHGGRLTSTISINYNSGSGLRVNDVASNLGQGWNLIAGGFITRMQYGEPDDQLPRGQDGEAGASDLTKYPAGYLYSDATLNASNGCHTGLTKYPLYKDRNHIYKQNNSTTADKELDHFAFQFNGRSGMFILNKENPGIGIPLGDTKMKIWYKKNENMPNTRTTIDTFFVLDENGLLYKFAEHEITKVLKTNYCDEHATTQLTQPGFANGSVYHESSFDDAVDPIVNPYIINGWYLTEVEDILTHRKIFVHYNTNHLNVNSGTSISWYAEKNYSLITHLISVSTTPDIADIEYPDGHQVFFNYATEQRVDLPGEKALASIDIKYFNDVQSRFELTTTYMIGKYLGRPVSTYQISMARLCLKSIKKIGVNLLTDDPPYVFDYIMGSAEFDGMVPAPFSHLKDIWGYYNGDKSVANDGTPIPIFTVLNGLNNEQLKGLCYIHNDQAEMSLNAKPGYASIGLLRQITFPGGGALQYKYEQNYGSTDNGYDVTGGVHVSETRLSSGVKLIDCDDNAVVTDYSYVLQGSSNSSLWGCEYPINTIGKTSAYYEPMEKHYHWGIRHGCFPFGCCKYRYTYPGILSRDQAIDLTGHQKFMETMELVLDIISVISTIMDVVTVCLSETGPGVIVALVIDAILSIVTIIITCSHNYGDTFETTIYYNSDLRGLNPLPVQYKRVEVNESSGSNGKTILEFTDDVLYNIWEPTNPLLSSKQRFAYWAYGLLKQKTVMNGDGDIVSQTVNDYDFSLAKRTSAEIYNNATPTSISLTSPTCKCLVNHSVPQKIIDFQNPNDDPSSFVTNSTSSNDMKAEIRSFYTGHVLLTATHERTFKPWSSTEYVETTTQYTYNDHNYQPSIISATQSNGDVNTKSIIYSGDAYLYGTNAGLPVSTLATDNIVNVPIASRTTVTKNNGTSSQTYVLSETITRFNELGNNDIKPIQVFERRRQAPEVFSGSTLANLGPQNYTDAGYKKIQTISYDGAANVINIKDEGDRQVTNIYGYQDKYIIASVINADQTLPKDGVCYTSFEDGAFGNWELGGTAVYDNNAITGKLSFVLNSSNNLHVDINSGSSYILSFWGLSNNVTITNSSPNFPNTATLIKSGPTGINGMTYYEYRITGLGNTVTISGNTTIDELRLYPETARMRTVTYDPLLGAKTSECDENNRITYYEYDEAGRLRFIRDDKYNVLKMYEYNYGHNMHSQVTCSTNTVYSNPEITEIFIKNDCEKDDVGEEVPFTVPAGMFTSTESQDEVDQMVQDYITANGQLHANQVGQCYTLYKNVQLSQDFTKEGCDVGYMGTTITYTVPAERYTSVISQADADHQAQIEIDANGQAYANYPGHADCIIDHEPDLIETGDPYCSSDHHYLIDVIDQNPNSNTYNVPSTIDLGLFASCGAPPASVNYENTTSYTATVSLTNITDGTQYSFSIAANTSATLGSVPAGNYEVTIATNSTVALDIHFYNYQQTTTSFNLTSLNIGAAASPMIKIAN